MADKKITELVATTTLDGGDLIPVVVSPLVAPVTKKITFSDLAASMTVTDGWTNPSETWTYASGTSFTISGDKTLIYTRGIKLKLTNNGSVKYFYVVGSSYSAPNTTVTITGGSDYALVAGAISANYYSRLEYPQGFPCVFNFAPAWTGSSSNPAIGNGTLYGKFVIRGTMVSVVIALTIGSTTTLGTGTWAFSIPVPASNDAGDGWILPVRIRDAGIADHSRFGQISAGGTTIPFFVQLDDNTNVATIDATTPMAWGNGDAMRIQGEYEMG